MGVCIGARRHEIGMGYGFRKIAKAVSEDFGDVVDFLLQPDCSGKINYKTARKGGYEGYGLNIRSRGQVAPKHKMG